MSDPVFETGDVRIELVTRSIEYYLECKAEKDKADRTYKGACSGLADALENAGIIALDLLRYLRLKLPPPSERKKAR
jgi:hypothetical protein